MRGVGTEADSLTVADVKFETAAAGHLSLQQHSVGLLLGRPVLCAWRLALSNDGRRRLLLLGMMSHSQLISLLAARNGGWGMESMDT